MSTMTTSPELSPERAATTPSTDVITLSETDRSRLQTVVHTGHTSARVRTRAQVLLKLGAGWSLVEVCRAFDVCRNTVVRVRTRFAEGGVDAVLSEQRQTRYRQALTGPQAAHLIAIACSPVPDGHEHWTLRMLAGKAVELGFVEKISPETIRALLKKRVETLAASAMVHPGDERRVRRRHGRRLGALPPAV
jgi:transposase